MCASQCGDLKLPQNSHLHAPLQDWAGVLFFTPESSNLRYLNLSMKYTTLIGSQAYFRSF